MLNIGNSAFISLSSDCRDIESTVLGDRQFLDFTIPSDRPESVSHQAPSTLYVRYPDLYLYID